MRVDDNSVFMINGVCNEMLICVPFMAKRTLSRGVVTNSILLVSAASN